MLPMMPDRVKLKVHLQAIGDDVLADLVQSGDLDPAIPPQIARYELGGAASFEWTPATAVPQERSDHERRAALRDQADQVPDQRRPRGQQRALRRDALAGPRRMRGPLACTL